MASDFLSSLTLDNVTAARVWQGLDRDTRVRSAVALYETEADSREILKGAEKAVADAIRFRVQTVRKLPVAKRAGYIATVLRPDEPLAALLLQALHLQHHKPLLGAFLDALKIPHEDGHIKEDAELEPPDDAAVKKATDGLYKEFDDPDVDLYLASLLAMDDELWAGARTVLEARRGAE